jgi:DNA-binding NarL/FixJ family response regulator
MIKVFIAEDDEIYSSYLRLLIETTDGLEFAGHSCNENLLDEILSARPDIVLMDVRMPKCDGIDVTRRLTARAPEISVVIVTGWVDTDSLLRAIKAHAAGFINKTAPDKAIINAIHASVRGEPFYDLGGSWVDKAS